MSFDQRLILDPQEVQSFVTPEQSLNYLREQIQAVRAHMQAMPPPPTQIIGTVANEHVAAGQEYLRWHNRLLITYGRAIGAISTCQAFGHISVAEFQEFKKQLIAVMVRREARFQMEGV